MESTGGSTRVENVKLAHGTVGKKKKHDIGQAPPPPCARTPPSTTTTEKYPIVKGKGHEACGAGGGGDDDEGGKEDKTVKDDVYCPHCDKWFLSIQACKNHMAFMHPDVDE